MKISDYLIRTIVPSFIGISLLIGSGFNLVSVVHAQPAFQEEISTPTTEEEPTKTPTETIVSTPNEIPAESLAEELTPTPTDDSKNLPTEPPLEISTHLPSDTPTETPSITSSSEPTEIFTEIQTNTPTETATPTPILTETPAEIPTEIPQFKWQLEINLNPDQAARIQSDSEIAQRLTDNQIEMHLSDQVLFLSGNANLDQVRFGLFEGLGSSADFLGGPAEINILLPVNSGDEITLALPSRIISGYSWNISPNHSPNLEISSSPKLNDSNGNETQTINFLATGAGDGTINLEYRRPFGPIGEIHAILNIWLPEFTQAIDLTNPNQNEIPFSTGSDSEPSQNDPFIGMAQSAPPYVWDWRDMGVISAVRDQGSCGSCWAFATVGIMESALRIASGISADLSEQFLVSCNNDGWDCDGGSVAHKYHHATIGNLQTVPGAVLESDMGYEGTNGTCQLIANHPYKLSNWGFIASSYYTVPTVTQIKNAIYTYGPITAGICAGDNFQNYSGGVFSTGDICTSTNRHMVNLVGWDDAEQYWILRNSWGEDWGENGYMRINWGTSNVGYGASWVVYNPAGAIPAKPVLLTPASGVIINSKTPTLTWNSVPNGHTYQVQVSKTTDFSSPVVDVLTTPDVTNYTVETPLSGDGLWYWRVKAFDSSGRDGDWATYQQFMLDTTPPAVPALKLPLEGATPVGIPSFTWYASSTANAYQYEIADNINFDEPLVSTPDGTVSGHPAMTSLTYKPVGMIAGTTYYWHVRARDAYGNWSDWSVQRYIIVQTSLPVAPVPTSPLNGFLTNTQPTFTWNSVPGGVVYQVQVANTSTFTGTIFEDKTKETGVLSHTLETPLTDGVWHWRVRAWNATHGAGGWSKARSFTFDSKPPLAPMLTSPVAEALVRTTPPFKWARTTSANAFQFEYGTATSGTEATFEIVHTSPVLTSRTYTPPTMSINGYYWRVRARDVVGNWGAWSAIRRINIYPPKLAGPGLISPPANAIINTMVPKFSWNPVSGGMNYTIQISRLSNYSSADQDTDTVWLPDGVLTYDAIEEPLSAEGLYYWRVSTTNMTYEMGPWTTSRTFTVDITPPGKPILSTPANNAINIRAVPTFTWKKVKTANAYQFEMADNSGFIDPILTTPGKDTAGVPLVVTKYKPSNIELLKPYFWHVCARDAAGNWGEWSETRSITILPPIPAAPALISPNSGFLTNNTSPTFTWGEVANGNTYQIQIDRLSSFTNLDKIEHTGTVGELSFTPDALSKEIVYYWRVRAININNEEGSWSSIRKFTIDTSPPQAPILSSPANDTTNIRGIPTFKWKSVSGANAYQFEFDNNLDFSSPELTTPGKDEPGTPLAVTSFKPPQMEVLTSFYWHVRARDVAGNWGDWSEIWATTIQPTIPVAPKLLSPAKGSQTNNTKPTFTWSSVTDGNTYQIQIDKLSNFSSYNKIDYTGPVGSFSYSPDPLTPNSVYFWRVRAINLLDEPGYWSGVSSFTLDTLPPAATVLSTPAAGVTISKIPAFTWLKTPTANAYQFEYGTSVDGTITTFTSIHQSPVISLNTYTPPAISNGAFHWHVKARDAAGNWGSWSELRSFTISHP